MRVRILIAVAGVLVVAAWLGVRKLHTYVSEDPKFCVSCHRASPEFAVWTSSQHSEVACQRCHHSGPDQGVFMLRSFLEGKSATKSDGSHAPVEIGACESCHLTHDRNWVQVGASRGHRVHSIEQKIACVKCHGAGMHRFEPPAAACRGCHGPHVVNSVGMHQVHCLACHDFLSVEKDLKPTRRDCLRCHQAQGLHPVRFPDDAPMRFTCSACHKPHAPAAEELVACASCHKDVRKAGLHAERSHGDCAKCHRAHGWRSERGDCVECHRKQAAQHYAHVDSCASCHSFRPGGPAAAPAPDGGVPPAGPRP